MLGRATREAGLLYLRWEVHFLAAAAAVVLAGCFLLMVSYHVFSMVLLEALPQATVALFASALTVVGIEGGLAGVRPVLRALPWFAAVATLFLAKYLLIDWLRPGVGTRTIFALTMETLWLAAVFGAGRALLRRGGRAAPGPLALAWPGLPLAVGGPLLHYIVQYFLGDAVIRYAIQGGQPIPFVPLTGGLYSGLFLVYLILFLVKGAPILIFTRWLALAAGGGGDDGGGHRPSSPSP